MPIWEQCVHSGRFIIPILLWVSVGSIFKSVVKKSQWSFRAKLYLYFCVAFACLLFLLVVRVVHETDLKANNMMIVVK